MKGKKNDSNKVSFAAFGGITQALFEVAKTLDFGARCYGIGNWKGVEQHRYDSAAMRHILKSSVEKTDPDSGLHHKAHAIASLLFSLQQDLDTKYPYEFTKQQLDLIDIYKTK